MSILNPLYRFIIQKRLKNWEYSKQHPKDCQQRLFAEMLQVGKNTAFGKDHHFQQIRDYGTFKQQVPLREYDAFIPYIERIKQGEKNVLYEGSPQYFAKTSGTVAYVKYIPVTKPFSATFTKAGVDLFLGYMQRTGHYELFFAKKMFLQGSPKLEKQGDILVGRMSGISYHLLPDFMKGSRLPSYQSNIMEDWEEKVNEIATETATEDVRIVGGIPPWVLMYFDFLKKNTSKPNIKDIFPNFTLYVHGGVNFLPYRPNIMEIIGKEVDTLDTYTASEGFIAFQEYPNEPNMAMTLCCDNGIFYEFVPLANYQKGEYQHRIALSEVKLGVEYVIVLNTIAGLWGYVIGDTVRFTSLHPYKMVITGRVAQYTSLFGEHIIEQEVVNALNLALQTYPDIRIRYATVAPLLSEEQGKSCHEWWIEWEKAPENPEPIAELLDKKMCEQNPYYADLINGKLLDRLKIINVQKNAFQEAFQDLKKLDGQNKVPLLANDRKLVEQLKKD